MIPDPVDLADGSTLGAKGGKAKPSAKPKGRLGRMFGSIRNFGGKALGGVKSLGGRAMSFASRANPAKLLQSGIAKNA